LVYINRDHIQSPYQRKPHNDVAAWYGIIENTSPLSGVEPSLRICTGCNVDPNPAAVGQRSRNPLYSVNIYIHVYHVKSHMLIWLNLNCENKAERSHHIFDKSNTTTTTSGTGNTHPSGVLDFTPVFIFCVFFVAKYLIFCVMFCFVFVFSLLFLLISVLSVLTVYDYPLGVFKVFWKYSNWCWFLKIILLIHVIPVFVPTGMYPQPHVHKT
jgi:hypothetical protein